MAATSAEHIWPSAEFFKAKVEEQQTRHARYDETASWLDDLRPAFGAERFFFEESASAAAEGASSAQARNPSHRHRSPSVLTSR